MLVWALVVAVVRQLPGRRVPAAPHARDRLRRRVPRHPDDHRDLPDRLRLPARGRRAVRHAHDAATRSSSGSASLVARRSCTARTSPRCTGPGSKSIHWSQTAAARSLGLSQWQTLRHVVVPQAVRRILPPLLNDFVALQKDTALVVDRRAVGDPARSRASSRATTSTSRRSPAPRSSSSSSRSRSPASSTT